ncbi:TetR family transcriptional regulator [Desulfuromonas sp. DDH964]|uniref:TetR/AcrR family transcriptional regulator n=1 Tax=Desulfuromonas sp. DDH964 TaxID=1823759 RepID=UPI00078CF238|nr:TetR/AcrR family transcriptional regulator [Desulfuromonas sp. DDH964]AMV71783.1 TetR family transcriptional regulator [Desulfuromonas sp. DDH964]
MSGLRETKKRSTRQAILAAAVELFAARGFERTSIGDLARTAGIGKGTIYGYFRTKEEIFLAFCEDELDFIFRSLAEESDPAAPLVDRLLNLFLAQFRYATRNREFGRILVREIAFPAAAASARARDLDARYLAALGELLAAACARGEIAPGYDPFLTAAHLYALYLVALSGWYTGYLTSEDEVENSLRTVLLQTLNGLGLRPADRFATAKDLS